MSWLSSQGSGLWCYTQAHDVTNPFNMTNILRTLTLLMLIWVCMHIFSSLIFILLAMILMRIYSKQILIISLFWQPLNIIFYCLHITYICTHKTFTSLEIVGLKNVQVRPLAAITKNNNKIKIKIWYFTDQQHHLRVNIGKTIVKFF